MTDERSGTGASRRRFLTAAAGATGGAAALTLLPPSLQAALAKPTPGLKPGLDGIEHVIFLMQENRSFDHYYGMMRGVRGFGDRSALDLGGGRTVFQQPNANGRPAHIAPFAARGAAAFSRDDYPIAKYVTENVLKRGPVVIDPQNIGVLPHDWLSQQAALGRGWNDNWIKAKHLKNFPAEISRIAVRFAEWALNQPTFPTTMTHYDRADIPFHYALADAFTICDAYHSSAIAGTLPNRFFHYAGSLGTEPETGLPSVTNVAAEAERFTHPGYGHTTYAERLQDAGLSWRVYQERDNFGDNALEYFATFRTLMRKVLKGINGKDYRTLDEFYADVAEGTGTDALGQLRTNVRTRLTKREQELFQRGLYRAEPGRMVQTFRNDVANDRLPEVSWIAAPLADCEHPSGGTPVRAAHMIYQVLEALADHRDVWDKTVVFLNYDENDGFFDHVPPPTPPKGTKGEFYEEDPDDPKPIGLGFRVPMTVISPWTAGGHVCSELFDHTSTLRFLERWLSVRYPGKVRDNRKVFRDDNISAWRRTVCGDLVSAFDFKRRAKSPPRLPAQEDPPESPFVADRWWPQAPEDGGQVPVPEPGQRPSRPLPYRPEASALLVDDGERLALTLSDAGARGSHFALYSYAYQGKRPDPRHFHLRRPRTVTMPLADGRYRISVTGPNRFRRDFAGSTKGRAVGARVTSKADPRAQVLSIVIQNAGDAPLNFTVRAEGYSTGARQVTVAPDRQKTVNWPAAGAAGWYDLTITAAEDPTFLRRLMGRVETGRPGLSPPAANITYAAPKKRPRRPAKAGR